MKLNIVETEMTAVEIKVGDVFADGNRDRVYVLIYDDNRDKYCLRALERHAYWGIHSSLAHAIKETQLAIKDGRLTHYPQDHYEMDIKFVRK